MSQDSPVYVVSDAQLTSEMAFVFRPCSAIPSGGLADHSARQSKWDPLLAVAATALRSSTKFGANLFARLVLLFATAMYVSISMEICSNEAQIGGFSRPSRPRLRWHVQDDSSRDFSQVGIFLWRVILNIGLDSPVDTDGQE